MVLWKDFVEYMVLQRLCNPTAVDAIYDYFVNNLSPMVIVSKYRGKGITKGIIRGYVQRLYEKSHFMYQLIPYMLRRIIPMLQEIEPAIERLDGHDVSRCKICDYTLPNTMKAYVDHVRRRHKDLVDRYTERIINRLNGDKK